MLPCVTLFRSGRARPRVPTRLCLPEDLARPGAVVEPGAFVGEACRAIACPALALCGWRSPHVAWRVLEVAQARYPVAVPCPILGDGTRMREVTAVGQPLAMQEDTGSLDPRAAWVGPWQPPPRPRARVRAPRAARALDVFLVDAMVPIGAQHRDPVAEAILDHAGVWYALATTPQVLAELLTGGARQRAEALEVVEVVAIDPAFEGFWYAYHKRPSEADRSLLQAALQDGRVRGIITSDGDLTETGAGALVSKLAGRQVRVLRPAVFADEYVDR